MSFGHNLSDSPKNMFQGCRSTGTTAVALVLLGFLALSLLGTQPVQAQTDDGWNFGAAVYLWGSSIGGTTQVGDDIEVDFKDIAENLEFALMGTFEARKGKWGLLTELIYIDIGVDKSVNVDLPVGPGIIDVTANADLDMQTLILHFAGQYNMMENNGSRLDLLAGVRYLDMDMKLKLGISALGQDFSREVSDSPGVTDAIIGAKGNLAMGKRWFLPYYVDIGTGQSDFTWQAMGGVAFRAASWVDLALTCRYLEWQFEKDAVIADFNLSGPLFGAIFRF